MNSAMATSSRAETCVHSTSAAPRSWLGQLVHTTHGQAIVVMLLIAIGFSVMPMVNSIRKPKANKDYSRWWSAATMVRNDQAMYPPDLTVFTGFIYPPAIAVTFYTPLSLLGFPIMVGLLCLLTSIGHVVSVFASVYFATGRWRDQHWLIYAVPIAVTVPFVSDIYFLGQFNLTMLAMMLVGFIMLESRRWIWAGILFAFPTSAKAFPLTILGYLVWRRRWWATFSMLAALFVMVIAAPALVRGVDRHLQESWTWLDRMVLSSSSTNLANQPERAFRAGNQSLVSVVNRLTRPTEPPGPADSDPDNFNANLIDIGPNGSFIVFASVAAAFCLAYILAMPRRDQRTRRTAGMEYAIVLLLIVIFSPKAGTYYYCWTIPALAIITAEALGATPGSARRKLILTGLLASIGIMATALTQAFNIPGPQTYGATLWGGVALLITLLALLWTAKREHPTSQTA